MRAALLITGLVLALCAADAAEMAAIPSPAVRSLGKPKRELKLLINDAFTLG